MSIDTFQPKKHSLEIPLEVHVEISAGEKNVKYEIKNHKLIIDRFLDILPYPANYGYILNTMSGDGDPLDTFIITPAPLMPNSFIQAIPIGMIQTEDEGGIDPKILSLPSRHMTRLYDDIHDIYDLYNTSWGRELLMTLKYFLKHYKDMSQKGKILMVGEWQGLEEALDLIQRSR